MIVEKPNLEVPHGNSTVWKYLNLEKFLDIVINKELYFSNALLMSDKKDGIIPLSTQKLRIQYLVKKGMEPKAAQESVQNDLEFHNKLKSKTFLSCWSINQEESYALWKIYPGVTKSGVAIKTTVSKLKKAVNNVSKKEQRDINIAKVKYSNHLDLGDFQFTDALTTKSIFYSYEQELRLFISLFDGTIHKSDYMNRLVNGIRVKVDIDQLISEIYVSPFADTWFIDVFQETINRINKNLTERIKVSQIEDN